MTDAEVAAADRAFTAWMRQNLDHAAEQFGVTIAGEHVLGWRLLSISAPVDKASSYGSPSSTATMPAPRKANRRAHPV